MAGVPHRCSNCGTRHTFARSWLMFVRNRQCRHCGSIKFRIDKWMQRRKQITCHCDGMHFPHRKGSKFCNAYVKILDEDACREYANRMLRRAS